MPAPISVHATIDDRAVRERLDDFASRDVPDFRRNLTRGVMREVLRRTITRNPVDTARSRSAWVANLEQLGESAPPGWEGEHPQASAITEGRQAGELAISDTDRRTNIRATNGVSYVPLLEFGTRNMPPFAMARRSLQEIAARLETLTHES